MLSIRQAIVTELLWRLGAIAIASGYQTDAGQQLFAGETPSLGPSDPDAAIALVVRDDLPSDQSGFGVDATGIVVTVLPIDVVAVAKADLAQPWVTVEAIIADIRKAIETADRSIGGILTKNLLRGRVRSLPRESGGTVIGATVEYRAIFADEWGAAGA